MRLITIPMSHYCEKARWGLTHAGCAYVEDAHLQVFHYLAVRPHSAKGMVPVLVTDSGAVADSTAILKFLDQRLPEAQRLYPAGFGAQVESLEERFDEGLGVETRRWVYFHWLNAPTLQVLKTAAQGTPLWERMLAPVLFPAMRRYLTEHLAVRGENVEAGLKVILECFDSVAEALSDGRPYLCGDRFTAADITFASMAAPVLLPAEYGIRLPVPEEAPLHARADIARFTVHPAGQFALRLFRNHRRQPSAIQQSVQADAHARRDHAT